MDIIEGIQTERNRVRELIKEYEKIGPPGRLEIVMMQAGIKLAEQAIAKGDTVQMLRSYQCLKRMTG